MLFKRKNQVAQIVRGKSRNSNNLIEALELRRLLSTSPTFATLATFNSATGTTPNRIVLDGNTLYGITETGAANDMGGIYSVPVTGGTPTLLASFDSTDTKAADILASNGKVYFSAENSAGINWAIYSVPETGGTPTVLNRFTQDLVSNLSLSGNTIYGEAVTIQDDPANVEIFSLPVTGGTPTTLATFTGTNFLPGGLVLSAGVLYGATNTELPPVPGDVGLAFSSTVFSLPVTGGTPTTLLFSGSVIDIEAISGNTLYGEMSTTSTTNVQTFSVISVSTAGAGLTVLANMNPFNVFVSGGLLFAQNGGIGFAGVPAGGGAFGNGAIFNISTTGGQPSIYYSFPANFTVNGSLIADSNGDLFGAEDTAGTTPNGTLFELAVPNVATHLAFTQEPTNAAAEAIISPAITVALEDASGHLAVGDNSLVTLHIASGALDAALNGTLSVHAVNGIATFSNISIAEPGNYTLSATDGALTAAASSTFDNSQVGSSVATPLFRLYDAATGDHLYTTDANENAVLAAHGWIAEGSLGNAYTNPVSDNTGPAIPLYRLYDKINHTHLFTTDVNEYVTLRAVTSRWTDENIAGYVFQGQGAASVAVTRLWNPAAPDAHLLSVDSNEIMALEKTGWKDEGTVGWVI